MGKSFDTHGPMGPWFVTTDEVDDPQDLAIRTWVNGELRQDSSTSQMIFSCAEQVAYLSTGFTLEAGDVILTGTPAGVGAASTRRGGSCPATACGYRSTTSEPSRTR